MSRDPKRFAFLDALRGVAFLMVLICHAAHEIPGIPGTPLRLLVSGNRGVQLFFIISALTLFLSMDARSSQESRPTLNFFIRRFFRIAPLFYSGILFYALLDGRMPGVGGLLWTLTFMHGWSPLYISSGRLVPGGWSIAAEMNFYLTVPLCYHFFKTLGRTLWGYFAALLASTVAWIALGRRLAEGASLVDYNSFSSWWPPSNLPTFFLGFCLYFALRGKIGRPEVVRNAPPESSRLIGWFLLVFAAYAYLVLQSNNYLQYLRPFDMVLALLIASQAIYPARFLVNPILCYVGKISFSAYITHFAALSFSVGLLRSLAGLGAGHWSVRFACLVLLAVPMTVLMSTISYHLIEVPGQAVGKQIIGRMESRVRDRASVAEATA